MRKNQKPQNIHRYVQDPKNKPPRNWGGLVALGIIFGMFFIMGNSIGFLLGAIDYDMYEFEVDKYPPETYQERRVENCRGDFTRIEILIPGHHLGCTAGPFFEWLGNSATEEL